MWSGRNQLTYAQAVFLNAVFFSGDSRYYPSYRWSKDVEIPLEHLSRVAKLEVSLAVAPSE
jgi:hypothetical protein